MEQRDPQDKDKTSDHRLHRRPQIIFTFWDLYGSNLMPGSYYMNLSMLSAAMEELDGDNVRVSSRGRVAERDIVQVRKPFARGPHVQRMHTHKKVAYTLFHARMSKLTVELGDARRFLVLWHRWWCSRAMLGNIYQHPDVCNYMRVCEMVQKTLFSTIVALEPI